MRSYKLIHIDEEMEDFLDFSETAYQIAKTQNIGVSYSKDITCGHLFGGKLVSALFTSTIGRVFSFDIVVDPSHQGNGLGKELAREALDMYRELEIYGVVDSIDVDVVSPVMAKILSRLGMKTTSSGEIGRYTLSEEIGRNYHTVDNDPNTWDKFQDFDINYYTQDDGSCILDIDYKDKKLVVSQRFGSDADAQSFARQVVDKIRVAVMNLS